MLWDLLENWELPGLGVLLRLDSGIMEWFGFRITPFPPPGWGKPAKTQGAPCTLGSCGVYFPLNTEIKTFPLWLGQPAFPARGTPAWNSECAILSVEFWAWNSSPNSPLPLPGVTGGSLVAQEELSKENILANRENSFCLFCLLLFFGCKTLKADCSWNKASAACHSSWISHTWEKLLIDPAKCEQAGKPWKCLCPMHTLRAGVLHSSPAWRASASRKKIS